MTLAVKTILLRQAMAIRVILHMGRDGKVTAPLCWDDFCPRPSRLKDWPYMINDAYCHHMALEGPR